MTGAGAASEIASSVGAGAAGLTATALLYLRLAILDVLLFSGVYCVAIRAQTWLHFRAVFLAPLDPSGKSLFRRRSAVDGYASEHWMSATKQALDALPCGIVIVARIIR